MEIWKSIAGYEEYYEISNTGKIKSIRKNRLITPISHYKNKYFNVMLSVNNNHKNISVHRAVALAFIPNPKNLPEVNHINGIKTDNRCENLEWCTRKENVHHYKRIGLSNYCYGEKKPKASFTNAQVRFIKENKGNLTHNETMLALGIDLKDLRKRQTICRIRNGRKYKRV